MTMQIGMLLYPELTQLDLTGPFELFHHLPDSTIHLLWKDTKPVVADSGLGLVPTTTLAAAPPLDLLFVPGGVGQIDLMGDDEVLGFLRTQGARARPRIAGVFAVGLRRQCTHPVHGARQRELRGAQALHEIAAPALARILHGPQHRVDRGEAARHPFRDGRAADQDPVPFQQGPGQRVQPPGRVRVGGRHQRPPPGDRGRPGPDGRPVRRLSGRGGHPAQGNPRR